MTFDNHSLERLKELGRSLPQEISTSQQRKSNNQKETTKHKLHPVEVETNPEQLFRELMEISPDGNVPPHLLERLKNLEQKKAQSSSNTESLVNKNSQDISNNELLELYTEFKQFLLEDDID
tara:strand:- start:3849 stop:4214 length:366 start_codon:yes stop_codon:yes gene_type:complete